MRLFDEEEEGNTFDAVHTAQNPYCNTYPCWCHEDANYHIIAIAPIVLSNQDRESLYACFGVEVTK